MSRLRMRGKALNLATGVAFVALCLGVPAQAQLANGFFGTIRNGPGPNPNDGAASRPACATADGDNTNQSAPKVVSTFPENGSVVRPGVLVVRVTFDQPMSCNGLVKAAKKEYNPCGGFAQDLILSDDRRSILAECNVRKSESYQLGVNSLAGPSNQAARFKSASGRIAQPYQFSFTTSSADPVTSVPDAISQATKTSGS